MNAVDIEEARSRPLTAPERDARNLILASTVRQWETEVCDVSDAASVAVGIAEHVLHNGKARDQEETYFLTEEEIRQIFFCVHQTQQLADRFKLMFYEALQA